MTAPGAKPLLLACSPRAGGNCDEAASLVREALRGPGGEGASVTYLRNHTVLPCLSCGHCARELGVCPLRECDDSGVLFDALTTAPVLVLFAPVYFYHVPAQLKAFIDRSQPWWVLRERGLSPAWPRRKAHVVLAGARPRGPRLFEGSLLSLRCWLDLFGYTVPDPLTLYGLEGADALARDTERRLAVIRYGESIRENPEPAPSAQSGN